MDRKPVITVSLRPQRVLLSLASSQVATQGTANSPVAHQAFFPRAYKRGV